MRHAVAKPHLNRTASHRKALYANMACALIKEKQIHTTIAKAKALRPYIERMVTFARKGDLSSRRHVLRHLRQKDVVKLLFDKIGPHFAQRPGGYTRIYKLGNRLGDAAPMVIMEFVDREALGGEEKAKVKETASKKGKAKETGEEKGKVKEVKETKEKAAKPKKSQPKAAKPKPTVKKTPKKAEAEIKASEE
jgi:large subunit ribosomal protein L17